MNKTKKGCGVVRAVDTHFEYADGTPFYPFGTTIYALLYQPRERIAQTLQSLKNSPFNKVRLCLFPKYLAYNLEEPPYFPFEKAGERWDFYRPNPDFWALVDEVLRALDGMDIQADLILFHPYDKWGFAQMTRQECETYLDFVVERLSCHDNIWWSLANEYDTMAQFPIQWWPEFARRIRQRDSKHHLLSNHNCLVYWDFSDESTTHCCIQDDHVQMVPQLLEQFGKPVIFDECCYEGNVPYSWGNISAFELVHRFWTAVSCGGYATHGETFLSDDDVLWWSKGGILKGESPARIAFLRQIMEQLPGPLEFLPDVASQIPDLRNLKENPHQVDKMQGFAKGLVMRPQERIFSFVDGCRKFQGHCGQDAYLFYYGRHCTAQAEILLPENGSYLVELLDVWEMTRRPLAQNVSGNVTLPLPGKEGIALLATKI